jgi:hypothetical protein
MFVLGVSSIISSKKEIVNTFILILSFTYIGGSCEPFALIMLLFLLFIGFLLYMNLFTCSLQKNLLSTRILIAFISCLISFIILYTGDGNKTREYFFEKIDIFQAFFLNIKTTRLIVLYRLLDIIPFILLFSFPAYYLGYLKYSKKCSKFNIMLRILIILLLYCSVLFIYQFPVTYITQEIAAYRALFPITLFSLLASFAIYYNLGQISILTLTQLRFGLVVSLLIVLSINIYTLITQLNILPKYANAYDKRIVYLLNNKKNDNYISVERLPNSGLLYSAEISTDSIHFSNIHLKRGLDLKSPVVLSNQN